MFELSHLRCFIAVAEELHFGRAAERLHMTQPPLSRQIQQLERDLGVSLINRSNRTAALTAAGRRFLQDAKRIIRIAEEARLFASRVASGEGGVLTIGFIPASGYELLPRIVSLMNRELPNVELVLKEMVTADQIDALTTRRIDFGILRLPVDRQLMRTLPVALDRMVLALPDDHRLAGSGEVSLDQLNDQPFVMYAPVESRYHHDLLTGLFRSCDLRPRFVQYARETHTILALAGHGAEAVRDAITRTTRRPA
jgi:DNA-binding transcriptional LysR family regulator